MAALLLSLSGITLTFGGAPLFEDAELAIAPGARIALVGRNGSGKSTLLKIAAGAVDPDDGERFVHPGATVRYLAQEPDVSGYDTIGDYVCAGLSEEHDQFATALLMKELGLTSGAAPNSLSGGELRRAALAQTLAQAPDILLLDEPTNHLDLPIITWLETKLMTAKSALVVISHDRRFLEKVTTQTVWIDRGRTHALNQGFAAYEAWRDKFLEEEETALHKLGRKIAAEEHWMRYGVTARRKRNMRRVAELKSMRKNLREARRPQGKVKFSVSEGETSGKRVITAENISKSYNGKNIIDQFSTKIARGERVGFVGQNGAGKTTLINMLIGKLAPDEGAVSLGTNLEIISLDQRRASLTPDMRLADAVADRRGDWVTINGAKRHVASYLQDFLFAPEQWRTPVSALSGGERGRLALAAALAKPSNLLVLDEPTNDLDLETLDLLEDLLAAYEGTLLLVSHDRSFLDHIVTSVITTDPDKPERWRRYAGGFDDMVAQRGSAPGMEKLPVKEKPKASEYSLSRQQETPASTAKQKLSFKDKYALENLPRQIEDLQEKIAKLKAALADPAFFERDADQFKKTALALSGAEARLSAAEDEWLNLELKRESIEQ